MDADRAWRVARSISRKERRLNGAADDARAACPCHAQLFHEEGQCVTPSQDVLPIYGREIAEEARCWAAILPRLGIDASRIKPAVKPINAGKFVAPLPET